MADQDVVRYFPHRFSFCTIWTRINRYFSPYPLTESEVEDPIRDATGSPGPSALPSVPRGRGRPPGSASNRPPKIPGVQRTTLRSHGRTSDLLAGGLTRSHLTVDKSVLWVCERCFKYMSEGSVWEMHAVSGISDARWFRFILRAIEEMRQETSPRTEGVPARCAYDMGGGRGSRKGAFFSPLAWHT